MFCGSSSESELEDDAAVFFTAGVAGLAVGLAGVFYKNMAILEEIGSTVPRR